MSILSIARYWIHAFTLTCVLALMPALAHAAPASEAQARALLARMGAAFQNRDQAQLLATLANDATIKHRVYEAGDSHVYTPSAAAWVRDVNSHWKATSHYKVSVQVRSVQVQAKHTAAKLEWKESVLKNGVYYNATTSADCRIELVNGKTLITGMDTVYSSRVRR